MLQTLRRRVLGFSFVAAFLFLPYGQALAQADVRVNMSHTPESATLATGQNFSYFINAANGGPDSATNVTLTDVLDPSFTFVFATVSPTSQGSCSQAGGTVTCNLNTMNPGIGAQINIVVTPTAAAASIDNTASISADQPDPNPANNSATNSVTVNAANSDMRVTMSHSPESVTLGTGQNVSYSLAVTNTGPSTATNVTLTDALDPSFTFVSATVSPPSQGSCSMAAGTITCNLNTMASGVGASIAIQVLPTSASAGIANTANLTADQPDPNPANNSATNLFTVRAANSDMRVTMTHFPDPVTVGSNLSYSINVSNSGPSTATGVTLTDPLPPGMALVSATVSPPSQGSCSESGGTVTCTLNTFTPGGGATVTIVVTASVAGTTTNTASLTADQPDPNPANNTASNDVTAVTGPPLSTDADLRVGITHSPDSLTLGGDLFIQYGINVTNIGPAIATGVTLNDSLPANLTFAGYSVSPVTQGSCSASGSAVTCNLTTLSAGTAVNVTLYAMPVSAGSVVTNLVNVVADQNDPNPGNNNATDNSTINSPIADVRVSMSHSPDPIVLGSGQFLQYSVSMVNSGPSPATGGTISDTLPGQLTFAGISLSPPTQGSCNQAAGTVSCSLNPLGSSTGVSLTIYATPNTAAATVSNTVTVAASEADPIPANNSATENVTTVSANADVRVSLSHFPDPARVGSTLQYSMNINNFGPSPATSVTLTDVLPAQLTFAGVSISPATIGLCSQAGGTVTCTMSTLASGGGASVTVFVTPNTVADVVPNRVTVTANEPDPLPANNAATDNVTILATNAGNIPRVELDSPAEAEGAIVAFAITDLGPASGNLASEVSNRRGQSVGYSFGANGNTRAVVYTGAGPVDLGTLGGANSCALSLSDSGVVVGQSETAGAEIHAFVSSEGRLRDLGTLGGRFSTAWGVNLAGQVVGASTLRGGYSHAFIYENGRMTDLNKLISADAGWNLTLASGFDDQGRILGRGTYAGEDHVFALTPLESSPARRLSR